MSELTESILSEAAISDRPGGYYRPEVVASIVGKLERENAELRAETREVKTVRQLHEICGATHLSMETALYATGILERLYKAEAQVAELQAVIERVRRYALEREWYGRRGRTVHSARIASDLFAMLPTTTTEGTTP